MSASRDSSQSSAVAEDDQSVQGVCKFGPEGCDPQADADSLACQVCNAYACDFHGDYPTDQHHAEGDWRCPGCQVVT